MGTILRAILVLAVAANGNLPISSLISRTAVVPNDAAPLPLEDVEIEAKLKSILADLVSMEAAREFVAVALVPPGCRACAFAPVDHGLARLQI